MVISIICMFDHFGSLWVKSEAGTNKNTFHVMLRVQEQLHKGGSAGKHTWAGSVYWCSLYVKQKAH